MTNQEMISDLNASLVKEESTITIIEYVIFLNEKILNIDIDFIDDLLIWSITMILVFITIC